jgi:phosphoglycerate dehydrogenase-like enzyme
MEQVHVLSTLPLPEEWFDKVRGVSPRLVVDQALATSVEEIPPPVWNQVEVLYTDSILPDPSRAPNLRWVQLDTAGIDHVRASPLWNSAVLLTTIKGIAPPTMAEFSLLMMLAFAYELPSILDHQARREWPTLEQRRERFTPRRELCGSTVGIVGYGTIGRELGRVAKSLGMRVLGVRRGRGDTHEAYRVPEIAEELGARADRLYLPAQLPEMLPECDYVVLVVPHTPETHHMIGEAELRLMKPTAVLINVARGGVVDEAALVRALKEGWIWGAAVDVFEREPLAVDSPLWGMPRVIISPHVAGFTPSFFERFTDLFIQNLQRYLEKRPLLNLVDRQQGY